MSYYTVKQIPDPSGKTKPNGKSKYRYIIVDAVTDEVLDDAQGYGYKSIKKAYRAYVYKLARFSHNNTQN